MSGGDGNTKADFSEEAWMLSEASVRSSVGIAFDLDSAEEVHSRYS